MTRNLARHLGLRLRLLVLVVSGVVLAPKVIRAYDLTRNDNLAIYWGQNSAGGQHELSAYCQDDTIDNIIIAFLNDFGTLDGNIQLNLADFCSYSSAVGAKKKKRQVDCSAMESQIKHCQDRGKIVTLSLGGAISTVGFSSDWQAREFADKIWAMFLGGSGEPRPFGDAVLDGVDLDIEQGENNGYGTFVNRLRERAKGGTKPLIVTAAPQCVFPDAYIGLALNEASFDAVYVQFYNNPCGLANPESFNFEIWDKWAKNGSANPDIKVYIGALAGQDGTGYVGPNKLASYITRAQKKWTSFGGVMLWDVTIAVENGHYHKAAKESLLRAGGASDGTPPSTNGTASSSISRHAHVPTSTSTSTSPTPYYTPYVDGAKWHRRSRSRAKHSH